MTKNNPLINIVSFFKKKTDQKRESKKMVVAILKTFTPPMTFYFHLFTLLIVLNLLPFSNRKFSSVLWTNITNIQAHYFYVFNNLL